MDTTHGSAITSPFAIFARNARKEATSRPHAPQDAAQPLSTQNNNTIPTITPITVEAERDALLWSSYAKKELNPIRMEPLSTGLWLRSLLPQEQRRYISDIKKRKGGREELRGYAQLNASRTAQLTLSTSESSSPLSPSKVRGKLALQQAIPLRPVRGTKPISSSLPLLTPELMLQSMGYLEPLGQSRRASNGNALFGGDALGYSSSSSADSAGADEEKRLGHRPALKVRFEVTDGDQVDGSGIRLEHRTIGSIVADGPLAAPSTGLVEIGRYESEERRRRKVAYGKFQYHKQGGPLGTVYRQERLRQQEIDLLLSGEDKYLSKVEYSGTDGRGVVFNVRGARRRESRYATNLILNPSDDEFEPNDSKTTAMVPLMVALAAKERTEAEEGPNHMAEDLIKTFEEQQRRDSRLVPDSGSPSPDVATMHLGGPHVSGPSGYSPAATYDATVQQAQPLHGLKHILIKRKYYQKVVGLPCPVAAIEVLGQVYDKSGLSAKFLLDAGTMALSDGQGVADIWVGLDLPSPAPMKPPLKVFTDSVSTSAATSRAGSPQTIALDANYPGGMPLLEARTESAGVPLIEGFGTLVFGLHGLLPPASVPWMSQVHIIVLQKLLCPDATPIQMTQSQIRDIGRTDIKVGNPQGKKGLAQAFVKGLAACYPRLRPSAVQTWSSHLAAVAVKATPQRRPSIKEVSKEAMPPQGTSKSPSTSPLTLGNFLAVADNPFNSPKPSRPSSSKSAKSATYSTPTTASLEPIYTLPTNPQPSLSSSCVPAIPIIMVQGMAWAAQTFPKAASVPELHQLYVAIPLGQDIEENSWDEPLVPLDSLLGMGQVAIFELLKNHLPSDSDESEVVAGICCNGRPLLQCSFAAKHQGMFMVLAAQSLQHQAEGDLSTVPLVEWALRLRQQLRRYCLHKFQLSGPSKDQPQQGAAPLINLLPHSSPQSRMERGRTRMNAPLAWEVILDVDAGTFRGNPNAVMRAMWQQLKSMGYLKSFRTKRVEDERIAKSTTRTNDGSPDDDEPAHVNRFATQFSLWGAKPIGVITAPFRVHPDAVVHDGAVGQYVWSYAPFIIVKGIMPLYARLAPPKKSRPSIVAALYTNASNNEREEAEEAAALKGRGKRVCIGVREVPIIVPNEDAKAAIVVATKGHHAEAVRETVSIQMAGTQRHFVKFVKAARAGIFDSASCGHATLREWHIGRMDDGSAEFEAMLKAVVQIQSCFRGWSCRAHNKTRMIYCIDAFDRYRKALVSYHEWFTKSLVSLRRFMIDNTLQVIQIEARNRHRDIVAEEAKIWKVYANKGVEEWQTVEIKIRARIERDWLINRHLSECRFEVRELIWHPYRLQGLWLYQFYKVETHELIARKAIDADEAMGWRAILSHITTTKEWADPANVAKRAKDAKDARSEAKRAERANRKPLSLANAMLL